MFRGCHFVRHPYRASNYNVLETNKGEPMVDRRIQIRILSITGPSCTVEMDGEITDDVLVPYPDLAPDQVFEATIVGGNPARLIDWRRRQLSTSLS